MYSELKVDKLTGREVWGQVDGFLVPVTETLLVIR